MTEYWKSNPRHFCEACKCWLGGNKVSIEFHEGGRRHKGNVERQLSESRKRATVKEKEAVKLSATLEEIEKAALVSYQRDQLGMPAAKRVAMATPGGGGIPLTPEMIQFEQDKIRKEMAKKLKATKKAMDEQDARRVKREQEVTSSSPWQQLTSPEGYPYYYNSTTGVTQWEAPSDITNAPNQHQTTPTTTLVSIKQEEDIKEEDVSSCDNETNQPVVTATDTPIDTSYGSGRVNPYGSWTTIAEREQTETPVTEEEEGREASKDGVDPSEEAGYYSDEDITFQEKKHPNTVSDLPEVKVEPGTFKGFGFKKKQNRSSCNIKERTSDW